MLSRNCQKKLCQKLQFILLFFPFYPRDIPSQPVPWQNVKVLSQPIPWQDFELKDRQKMYFLCFQAVFELMLHSLTAVYVACPVVLLSRDNKGTSFQLSLCPGTMKRLLSLCPTGQGNYAPLETLVHKMACHNIIQNSFSNRFSCNIVIEVPKVE